VDVSDDGPGMPAAERALATQRFWRSPAHQNIDGTGLGLTIAHVIAEASGGRLDLLPADPHGLLARLVLPAAYRAPHEVAQPPQPATLDSR
jgi:signal transduction histidine kinase